MGTQHIASVTPEAGVVDSLTWSVQSHLDFYNKELRGVLLLGWSGVVAFYREPIAGHITPGPQTPRLEVQARWLGRDKATKLLAPADVTLSFGSDVPGDALSRVERFRDRGRLFARIEGKFLYIETGKPGVPAHERANVVLSALLDSVQPLWAPFDSEPYELTRDVWSAVLRKLRPEDRAIIEVALPAMSPRSDAGKRILKELEAAQSAYDWGPIENVPRSVYVAIDEVEKSAPSVEAAYGSYVKGRVLEQCKAIKSLCNPDRHGSRSESPPERFDRALALHVLVSAKSLVAVLLAHQ